MPTDVLAPLDPFRGHHLYPRATVAVLMEKRTVGVHAALAMAQRIADTMGDIALEKRLR